MAIPPHLLAADGDDVLPGIEPPSEEEQIAYLAANGWPMPAQHEAEAAEGAGGHDAT